MTTTGTNFSINYTVPKGKTIDMETITVMVTYDGVTTRYELDTDSPYSAVLTPATAYTTGSIITGTSIPLAQGDGTYRVELVEDQADTLANTSTITSLSKGMIRKITNETSLEL